MADKGKEIISGNEGNVWVNTEQWANITNIEAKATAEYEDVNFVGDNNTYKRYTGTNIEGSITLKKIDSRAQKLLAEGFRTGNMPNIKIVVTTAKVNGENVERLALYDVTFTELQLAKLESKAMIEEELPFSASSFEYLELI
ncbi:phage tail tube protein [Clostridium brassicae]|uniref:Phage tail tube protein n=1 Tax=Clostridium brassicae TaxID=2999072 RepID=A0ABT4D6N5_9CLOT|nr:phage tail tube protein [Clostridium brassicae]MCY6957960.1 phage tail tube protein [Clostridium brassicae]